MMDTSISQDSENFELPSPKQFRANFKEIFDNETTFGSPRAARLELLETVFDFIQEYLKHGCRIVYLHKKLREAGFTGSRKELSEWLIAKGLWIKREAKGKNEENEETPATENLKNTLGAEVNLDKKEPVNTQSVDPAPEDKEKEDTSKNQTVVGNESHNSAKSPAQAGGNLSLKVVHPGNKPKVNAGVQFTVQHPAAQQK